MRRAAERIAAATLIVAGLAVLAGYLVAVAVEDDRASIVSDWAALASYGVAVLVIGMGWMAVSIAASRGWRPRLRIPHFFVGLVLFVLAVGAGFAIAVLDTGFALIPFLAAMAFAGVTLVFLRLGVSWMSTRRIAADELLYPGLWGAIAAPFLLIPVQALALGGLVLSALLGAQLGMGDMLSDWELERRIEEWAESSATGTTTTLPDVLTTPTGAFGVFAMLAIVAPLTEELVKSLGAILLLDRRPLVTERAAFIAAISAGLGFAVVEGLGYALIDPLSWHQIALIRAPVVVVHVAATTIVVLGWQRMRQRGGYGLLWYYLVAVGLHAAWNGLFAAVLLITSGAGDAMDLTPGESLATLTVVAALGVTLLAAFAWVVLNARRIGRAERASADRMGHLAGSGVALEYPRVSVPASWSIETHETSNATSR